jgi:ribonucleoside-diphosphate reductase alpha chain
MESIMHLAYSEAMLFKYGSGTGTDLSPIRSSREKLSGGGRPSGPLSFLKVYDQVANVVKSGGKTRRAAKMNTLRDWHGDIEEFIDAKQKEEKKAWALIEQGYDGSYNGDAYGSVMYQNENLSVRISDEFMQAALDGKEWWTRRSTDGKPLQKKDAAQLLHKIAEGTWTCGDPGLQYDGAIQKWHTCKGDRADPLHQPVFGIRFPQQHRLQPRLAQPDEIQARGREVRHRAFQGGGAAFHHRAGNHC